MLEFNAKLKGVPSVTRYSLTKHAKSVDEKNLTVALLNRDRDFYTIARLG